MQELQKTNVTFLDSREVADMVEKQHAHLLRDIDNYCNYLIESKIGLNEFFIKSTYKDKIGRTLACYQITKKGCELIAHKMTGKKGVQFTASYINRFHELENAQNQKPAYQQQQLEEYNYTPKYYNGIQVVSISDIAYFLKANRSMIQYHIKHNRLFKKNKDYYLVEKAEMAKFKIDNPSVSPLANCMYVITKSGYIKLMKLYNQSENLIEFKTLEEPKEKTSIKKNVPIREDKVIQEVIRRSNEEMTALKLSIEKFNAYNSEDDFHFYQEMMKEFINSLVRSVSVLVHAEVAI